MTGEIVPAGPLQRDITTRDKGTYRTAHLDLHAELAALTPHTRRAYARALRQFRSYCDAQGWQEPTPQLLRRTVLAAWEADLRGRGLSRQTIAQYLAAVRWAAGLAADQGLLDDGDLAALRRVKVKASGGVRQGTWLEAPDLLRLVRAPRGQGARAVRDRAVLALLAGCALRRAELCSLSLGHLDERDGVPMALVNLMGKGAKLRSVAIPEFARPFLAAWLRLYRASCETTPESPLVCEVAAGGKGRPTGRPLQPASVYRILRQATASAGLPDIAPHDLRRTAAKLMLSGGAGLDAIRDALGHASVSTTERYLETAQGPALGTLAMDRAMNGPD